jgi:hypothetical protein
MEGTMKIITRNLIQELLSADKEPCLSLYMPTHRHHPENLQDPVRYKNLVKQLEESLSQNYSSVNAEKLLKPFLALGDDFSFWNHTSDGLGVFGADKLFRVIGMHEKIEELAVAASSFHTKPLWKYLQAMDQYHVLGLSLNDITLFEGNRYSLGIVEFPDDAPITIKDALGDELTEKHLTVAAYGGSGTSVAGMYHGHGAKKDEIDKDAERYFRVVADFIRDTYSEPTGWPLILAALPEHHNLFQKVSKNASLIKDGVIINPSSVSLTKLAEMAWQVMEPQYLKKIEDLTTRFGQGRAIGKGSADIKEVALAAVAGRVDTLLIEADRIIEERITKYVPVKTNAPDPENQEADDLLDDMGELVMKMGGEVFVLSSEKMPSKTGLAAIFRY